MQSITHHEAKADRPVTSIDLTDVLKENGNKCQALEQRRHCVYFRQTRLNLSILHSTDCHNVLANFNHLRFCSLLCVGKSHLQNRYDVKNELAAFTFEVGLLTNNWSIGLLMSLPLVRACYTTTTIVTWVNYVSQIIGSVQCTSF